MIPTFAPLPSMVPLAEELDWLEEGEEDDELELLLVDPPELLLSLEEPQAVRDIAAAIPSTASDDTLVLRMRCKPFQWWSGLPATCAAAAPKRCDCCGREHIVVTAVTASSDTNSLRKKSPPRQVLATSPGKTVSERRAGARALAG
jgi:hypothetical protein